MKNKDIVCKCINNELYGKKYQTLSTEGKDFILQMDKDLISHLHENRDSSLNYLLNREIMFEVASKMQGHSYLLKDEQRKIKEREIIAMVKHIKNPLNRMSLNDLITSNKLTQKIRDR